jgi:phosphoribosylamine--glycine ligase
MPEAKLPDMKLLVIGSGGREHALAWKLSRERAVREVIVAPGNAGIASPGITGAAAPVRCAPSVAATDITGLLDLARREAVDLTIVGPEAPLEKGLADRFAAAGLPIFGPTQAAARLETSKAFAKALMARMQVPTAAYRVATSPEEARTAINELCGPTGTQGSLLASNVVLKADGLAGGKGVIVPDTREEALAAVDALMLEGKAGDAGRTLVVEERLEGPEVSCFFICDGTNALPLVSAQDHKRIFDDDLGPNTGGMGAFAPSPLLTPALDAVIHERIVSPVLRGLAEDGTPFRGFLYAGLMLTADGPKVIEFNVRFGDPEAQVVLPMIESDLAPLLLDAAQGRLSAGSSLKLGTRPHVGVVLASRGYPEHAEKGQAIEGLSEASRLDDVLVFHAGTKREDDEIVTDGGRVLCVVGRGVDYEAAIARAYEGASRIRFEGMQLRRDIGQKALRATRPDPAR